MCVYTWRCLENLKGTEGESKHWLCACATGEQAGVPVAYKDNAQGSVHCALGKPVFPCSSGTQDAIWDALTPVQVLTVQFELEQAVIVFTPLILVFSHLHILHVHPTHRIFQFLASKNHKFYCPSLTCCAQGLELWRFQSLAVGNSEILSRKSPLCWRPRSFACFGAGFSSHFISLSHPVTRFDWKLCKLRIFIMRKLPTIIIITIFMI